MREAGGRLQVTVVLFEKPNCQIQIWQLALHIFEYKAHVAVIGLEIMPATSNHGANAPPTQLQRNGDQTEQLGLGAATGLQKKT